MLTLEIGDFEQFLILVERSRDGPLDVVAQLRRRLEPDTLDRQDQHKLVAHTHRIRSVDIVAETHEHLVSTLDCILSGQVPGSLTHLSIHIRYLAAYRSKLFRDGYPCQLASRANLTKLYDQLHSLHLNGVILSRWGEWEGCSFSQLKELVLGRNFLGYREIPHILAAATNLQLLEFRHPKDWPASTASLRPVLRVGQGHKVLRTRKLPFTTIRRAMERVIHGAWETELIVDAPFYFDEKVFPHSSTVTALSLNNGEESDPGQSRPIHEILKIFPNLQALTLERFNLSDSVLSSITRQADLAESQLPQLSVLRLHLSRIFDHDAFMAMVASHPIRRLEIWESELRDVEGELNIPILSSPLYFRLTERVPEIYIVES